MKTSCSSRLVYFLVAAGLAVFSSILRAQVGIPIGTNAPIVTIRASDPGASEAGNPGAFIVSRGDRTNGDLYVWLQVAGTAMNGVDYQTISNIVVIPDGAHGTVIPVTPIDDALPEPTESVVVRVVPSPLLTPVVVYIVGTPNTATVYIADNDGPPETNHPPMVNIVQPMNGAIFRAGANIGIAAEAKDADGYVTSVEFFANDHSLGVRSNSSTAGGIINAYTLMWSNVPAGDYRLTAKATDNLGAMGISPVVQIAVRTNEPPPPPPPTNELTIVNIVATDPYASEGLVMWCSNLVIGVNALAGDWAWRTNCPNLIGTNTATFTVRRSGPTNNSLRVYYGIGGSASNGVDYAALPGVVTIPAGRHAARITIVPIDDAIPEGVETVVLRLHLPPLPLDPADSPYTIGRPESAAAFIVDNDRPPPPCGTLHDGVFHACDHLTNRCFRVECSTNLVNWEGVCTNSLADGIARHLDPDAGDVHHRFFRLIPVPCPVEEP